MARCACTLFVPRVGSLVGFAPMLLVGLVSVLLSSSLVAAASNCPALVCAPLGQQSAQTGQCSVPTDGALEANGPGQIGMVYEQMSGEEITTPEGCCTACLSFPATCRYWTFGLDENSDRVCYLYTAAICDITQGSHYFPRATLNQNFNYSTGGICPSILSPPPPVPVITPAPDTPSPPPPAVVTPAPDTPSPPPPAVVTPPTVPSTPPPAGVVGDPHYTGADQSHFDFTGLPGKSYCMLSDTHLHVNVFHGGRFDRWGANPHKPLTWIRQLAVLWGHHIIHLAAREGAEWHYGNGYMGSMTVDNEPIQLSKPGDSAFFFDGKVQISWVAGKQQSGDDEIDVYEVKIRDVLHMTLKLRPEVELLRTAEDGVVHFGVELPELTVSPQVHGVLGQTFRGDHQNRLAMQKLEYSDLLKVKIVPGENAEGFIDGRMEDYETSSLFRSDCSFSRFTRNQEVDLETAAAVELGSGAQVGSSYSGGNVPRKMMKSAASSK